MNKRSSLMDHMKHYKWIGIGLALALGLQACGKDQAEVSEPAVVTAIEPDSTPITPSRKHEVLWYGGRGPTPSERESQDRGFDFQTRSPLDYLDSLKATYEPAGYSEVPVLESLPPHPLKMLWLPNGSGNMVWGVHRGWLRSEDIDDLIALFGNTTPCSVTVSSAWSLGHLMPSTVGSEAALLVASYRAELNPNKRHGFPYGRAEFLDEASYDELRAWWQQHQRDVGK